MSPEEIAYVAGVLEGEGCFDIHRYYKDHEYPKIRMETTDLDVAERVQECLGAGTIAPAKKRQAHWKQSYVFQISKAIECERVLRAIYPWMSQRRREKIDELLKVFDGRRGIEEP